MEHLLSWNYSGFYAQTTTEKMTAKLGGRIGTSLHVLQREQRSSSRIEQNFHVSDDRWIRLATREHFCLENTRCSGNWKSPRRLAFLQLHFSGFYRLSFLESSNVSFRQKFIKSYFERFTKMKLFIVNYNKNNFADSKVFTFYCLLLCQFVNFKLQHVRYRSVILWKYLPPIGKFTERAESNFDEEKAFIAEIASN